MLEFLSALQNIHSFRFIVDFELTIGTTVTVIGCWLLYRAYRWWIGELYRAHCCLMTAEID